MLDMKDYTCFEYLIAASLKDLKPLDFRFCSLYKNLIRKDEVEFGFFRFDSFISAKMQNFGELFRFLHFSLKKLLHNYLYIPVNAYTVNICFIFMNEFRPKRKKHPIKLFTSDSNNKES